MAPISLSSQGQSLSDLALLRQAPNALCVLNAEGLFLEASEAFYQWSGWAKNRLQGQAFEDWLLPEDGELLQQQLRLGRAESPSEQAAILRFRKASGEFARTESFWSKLSLQEGQTWLLVSLREITEEHRNEQVIRTAAQMARVGGFEMEVATEECYLSEQVYRILELPPDFGSHYADIQSLFHEDYRAYILQMVERLTKEGGTEKMDYQMYTHSGQAKWVRSWIKAEKEAGRVVRIFGTLQDIDEQKRAEFLLAQSENLLSTLVNHTHRGLLVLDESDCIFRANPALLELLDLPTSPEAIKGKPFVQLLEKYPMGREFLHQIGDWGLDRIGPELQNFRQEIHCSGGPIFSLEHALLYDRNTYQGRFFLLEDVTEQRRQTYQLESLAQNLEEAQRLANIGSFEWNLDEENLAASRNMKAIFELTDEPSNMHPYQMTLHYCHPEDQEWVIEQLNDLIKNPGEAEMIHRIITAKGNHRWLVSRAYTLMDPTTGRTYKMRGTFQDITEKKRAEEEIERTREVYRLALEASQDGFWDWDVVNGTIYFSPRWKEMLGYQDHELPNTLQMWRSMIFPEDLEAAMELVEDFKADRIPKFEAIQRFYHKDGSTVYIFSRAIKLKDDSGQTIRMIGAHSDVTEITRAKEEAEAHQRGMEEVYQIVTSFSTQVDRQIRELLRLVAQRLGMEAGLLANIDGNHYRIEESYQTAQLIDPEGDFHLADTICEITYGSNRLVAMHDIAQSPHREHPACQKNSAQSYIGIPVLFKGWKYGTINFFSRQKRSKAFEATDLDLVRLVGQWIGSALERRAFETELVLAKEAAERASAAKAEFVSAISHEIRTPLNAVIGMSNLLQANNPRPEDAENLKTLSFSANHLLNLINDVLDFSKIEAGKLQLNPHQVDLSQLLQSLRSVYQPKSQETGLEFRLELAPDLPQYVLTDEMRLNQVLQNLLSNAFKFTKAGSVTLRAENRSPGQDPALVYLAVADTGIGMGPDVQEQIFQSFSQADPNIARQYGGTGLGLSISQKIVGKLGGELQLSSQAEVGSTFYFAIPLPLARQTGSAESSAAEQAESPQFEGMRVLLVEDNLINQKVACKFLEAWGVEIVAVDSGQRALQALQEKAFELVLMDLQMPELDGYQTMEALRGNQPDHPPVVALTASSVETIREKAQNAGMVGFLAKPFRPEELQRVLHKFSANTPSAAAPTLPAHHELDEEELFSLLEKDSTISKAEILQTMAESLRDFEEGLRACFLMQGQFSYENDRLLQLYHKMRPAFKILGLKPLLRMMEELKTLVEENHSQNRIEEKLQEIGQLIRLIQQKIEHRRSLLD